MFILFIDSFRIVEGPLTVTMNWLCEVVHMLGTALDDLLVILSYAKRNFVSFATYLSRPYAKKSFFNLTTAQ